MKDIIKNIEEVLDKNGITGKEKEDFINSTKRTLDFDVFMSNKYNINFTEVKAKHDLYFEKYLSDPEFKIRLNDAFDNGTDSTLLINMFNEYTTMEGYSELIGEDMFFIFNFMLSKQ